MKHNPRQMTLFNDARENIDYCNKTTSTFIDNMKLPIHRWYRYSAGFSAKWVEKTILDILENNQRDICCYSDFTVLDPFAGSGTTMLVANQIGVSGCGFESHPLVAKIASAKLLWNVDVCIFKEFADSILQSALDMDKEVDTYPEIIHKCYSEVSLSEIDKLKYALKQVTSDTSEYYLSWLAFIAILRPTSHVGTAQWQYVLPNKSKSKVLNVYDAYKKQVDLMCHDIDTFASYAKGLTKKSIILQHDTRNPYKEMSDKVDLIITSPPYANNYDYADATRLELCILGDISGWSDLQHTVRSSLVRSCTQHVSKERPKTFDFLDESTLRPIRDDIFKVCKKLDEERHLHGGKKNYHTMIALYFLDLARVWINLRELCKENSDVCFVVGDSAPYGIYVPVDEWLGRLAVAAGFQSFNFTKTRDRNIKWKNRKHSVPLKEGQLWVKG